MCLSQGPRPGDALEAAGRQLADLSRRLLRPAPQQADADHARQRSSADARLGVADRVRWQQIKATPILVNGVHLHHGPRQHLGDRRADGAADLALHLSEHNQGFHIGHRGAAVYKDSVFLTTPDAHLVALDAQDGKVKWNVEIADCEEGLLVDERAARHPQSPAGRRVGRLRQPARHAEVVRPRDRARRSGRSTARRRSARLVRPSGGATGGQMWMTGTYDPDLNLVYVGTGNPTPVLNGPHRPGDNRWTCSIVALNPDTGKLRVGLSGVAARHSRLGRRRSACARRRRLRRRAAQDAAAGVAQRLLLRARSHERQEPADDAVRRR